MDLHLRGKRALVTGSSSGVGEGIAHVLAREGATVMIHGRDVDRTHRVAAAIRAAGGTAHTVTGALDTPEGCAAVASATLAELGGIDILVNNAGGMASSNRQDGRAPSVPLSWFDVPWDDWRWTYEQNVGAAVRLIHAFTPGMQAQGWGRIVNIATAAATQPEPALGDYQAAKAAMVNLTSSLAKTLGETGVTVNSVSPGTILTPGVETAFRAWAAGLGWKTQDWDEIERRFTAELIPQPIKRFGRAEDIGRMVALLASPLSGYMTGANYRVDGGQCRSVN